MHIESTTTLTSTIDGNSLVSSKISLPISPQANNAYIYTSIKCVLIKGHNNVQSVIFVGSNFHGFHGSFLSTKISK